MDTPSEATPAEHPARFALNVRLAAMYLIATALFGIVVSIFGLGPHHPEFEAQPLPFRLGKYAREYTFILLYIVAGIYILRGRSWARKLAIGALAVGIFYGAHEFAWGFAVGQPSARILLISYGVVAAWNGLWIVLLSWRPRPVSGNEA